MGYSFALRNLIKLVHEIRWSEEMPKDFQGLDFNWIMEDIVDKLMSYQDLLEKNAN